MVQSDLLKRTGRTLKRIKKFPVLFLKYGRKISLEECSIFGNFAFWNSFSKVSLHFNKMNNSSRKLLQTYSEKCIFYVIQHIVSLKQSVVAALEVLRESLKIVLNEVHFTVTLHSFHLPPFSHTNPSFLQVNHFPSFRANISEQLPKRALGYL